MLLQICCCTAALARQAAWSLVPDPRPAYPTKATILQPQSGLQRASHRGDSGSNSSLGEEMPLGPFSIQMPWCLSRDALSSLGRRLLNARPWRPAHALGSGMQQGLDAEQEGRPAARQLLQAPSAYTINVQYNCPGQVGRVAGLYQRESKTCASRAYRSHGLSSCPDLGHPLPVSRRGERASLLVPLPCQCCQDLAAAVDAVCGACVRACLSILRHMAIRRQLSNPQAFWPHCLPALLPSPRCSLPWAPYIPSWRLRGRADPLSSTCMNPGAHSACQHAASGRLRPTARDHGALVPARSGGHEEGEGSQLG